MSTRRGFLKGTGLVAGGLAAAPLVGVPACKSVPVIDAPFPERDRVVLGLHPSSSLPSPEDAIHRTLEDVDMSWLGAGDSVFVKLACNSGNTHPAVTSPVAVRAMCKALFDRGAGRVVVGDQSGVMQVRNARSGKKSSTKILMEGNGLLAAIEDAGAEPHFFDDGDFDDGYVEATMPVTANGGTPWKRPAFIARIATEVDHIVYLPRLSSHLLTGYTHGHKLAVGWLRDDSRHDMHHDAGDIYEKYTDVNYCDEIRSRFRLVLTYAEEILLDGGPDGGHIATADPRVVLASTHLANHDAVSVALLTWAQKNLGTVRNSGGIPWGPWASLSNTAFLGIVGPQTGIPWESGAGGLPATYFAHDYGDGIHSDRALLRAYDILGGVPSAIDVALVGEPPVDSLRAHLKDKVPTTLV